MHSAAFYAQRYPVTGKGCPIMFLSYENMMETAMSTRVQITDTVLLLTLILESQEWSIDQNGFCTDEKLNSEPLHRR